MRFFRIPDSPRPLKSEQPCEFSAQMVQSLTFAELHWMVERQCLPAWEQSVGPEAHRTFFQFARWIVGLFGVPAIASTAIGMGYVVDISADEAVVGDDGWEQGFAVSDRAFFVGGMHGLDRSVADFVNGTEKPQLAVIGLLPEQSFR